MSASPVCPRCGANRLGQPLRRSDEINITPVERFRCGTWVSTTGEARSSHLCDKMYLVRSLFHVIPVLELMEQSMSKSLSVIDVKQLTWAIKTLKESIQEVIHS